MSEFVVQGLDGLLRRMEDLPYRMQKVIIVRALRKGAEPIRVRAQELAPTDPDHAEHPLKEGMMITVSDQSADGATAKIGPERKAFYGGQQEFGNIHHGAQPFLRPAFDEKLQAALDGVGGILAEEIEKALKG